MTLEKDLESHVSSVLMDYDHRKVSKKKIVRDAVLGTYELTPLEVNLIDTPFIQRLRCISQNALACLTYPSATHNRFEHSLGVSKMADGMAIALKDEIDETTRLELRIAGLLHDIGHGPFSHASEEIIGQLMDVKKILDADSRFSPSKPHEMITHKLLQTNSFRDFFNDLLKLYGKTGVNLDNISNMIIGSMDDPNKEQYKADIINGAFDADKLDYLIRDSYFTGIKMAVDVERIRVTQMIEKRPDKMKRIITDVGGVHILEQILFNKMLLYPAVYHHHKVRAAECMFKSLLEIIADNALSLGDLKFDKTSDFLRVDDHFFLTTDNKPKKMVKQILKIKQRKLLKRALVISRKTLKKEEGYEELLALRDRLQNLRDISKEIVKDKSVKGKCEYYDIWVDLPEDPRFPEPSKCLVRVTDTDYETLDKFFPVAGWSTSFKTNKWKGYVFGPPELQKTIDSVSRNIFEYLFNLELNNHATILAKHSSYGS